MNKQKQIIAEDGSQFEIPAKGSLGLLALGYQGLIAWREKRREIAQERKKDATK